MSPSKKGKRAVDTDDDGGTSSSSSKKSKKNTTQTVSFSVPKSFELTSPSKSSTISSPGGANGSFKSPAKGTKAKSKKTPVKEDSEDESDVEKITGEVHDDDVEDEEEVTNVVWSKEDREKLLTRISEKLPKTKDTFSYKSCLLKIDWKEVAFDGHSEKECEEELNLIISKVRKFRTLVEVLEDAMPIVKYGEKKRMNKLREEYPDLPTRPLTPYFRYYHDKAEAYKATTGITSVTELSKLLSQEFKSISEKAKAKYQKQYDDGLKAYYIEKENFLKKHPELKTKVIRASGAKGKKKATIIRARTPLVHFIEAKGKPLKEGETAKDRNEKMKEKWNQLKDGKKIKYIRKSYEEELRYFFEFQHRNKNLKEQEKEEVRFRSVLSEADKKLLDKYNGKPEKPPISGYSYFSSMAMKEMKDLPPGQEKLRVQRASELWKKMSDTQKKDYNLEAKRLQDEYTQDMANYMENLSQEEKEYLILIKKEGRVPSDRKIKQLEKSEADWLAAASEHPVVSNAALNLFVEEKKKEMLEKNPNLNLGQTMTKIHKKWASMQLGNKSTYLHQAASDNQVNVLVKKKKTPISPVSPTKPVASFAV